MPTILVNKAQQRIYVLDDQTVLASAPCSTGKGTPSPYGQGTTPAGLYRITGIWKGGDVAKILDPTGRWNPYGPYVADLDVETRQLAIHGTSQPDTLGQPVTAGCIRISNDLLSRLVKDRLLTQGTLVNIVED